MANVCDADRVVHDHDEIVLDDYEQTNAYFESLLRTVSATVYFASPAVSMQPVVKSNRFIHNKAGVDAAVPKSRKRRSKYDEQTIVAIQQDALAATTTDEATTAKDRLREKIASLTTNRKRDPTKPDKRQRSGKKRVVEASAITLDAEQVAANRAAKHAKLQADKSHNKIVAEASDTPSTTEKAKRRGTTTIVVKEKSVAKTDDGIVFANITLPGDDRVAKTRSSSVMKGSKKARLESALARVEADRATMALMEPGARAEHEATASARLALLKARGVRIRNDPALLKKSLKSDESQKRQRAKKWEGRMKRRSHAKAEKAAAIRSSIEA